MIVSPLSLNYKLIIGALIAIITILSVLGLSKYNAIENQQHVLEAENELMKKELFQLASKYDETTIKNQWLATQLNAAASESTDALQHVQLLEDDILAIAKVKNALAEENLQLQAQLRDFNSLQTNDSSQLKNVGQSQSYATTSLYPDAKRPYDVSNAHENIPSTIINLCVKTNQDQPELNLDNVFEVNLSLAKNSFVDAGSKTLYIQLLNPDFQVVNPKGIVQLGDTQLKYSYKKIVNYQNDDLNITANIKAITNGKPLKKGLYTVSAYHNGYRLANTIIALD